MREESTVTALEAVNIHTTSVRVEIDIALATPASLEINRFVPLCRFPVIWATRLLPRSFIRFTVRKTELETMAVTMNDTKV